VRDVFVKEVLTCGGDSDVWMRKLCLQEHGQDFRVCFPFLQIVQNSQDAGQYVFLHLVCHHHHVARNEVTDREPEEQRISLKVVGQSFPSQIIYTSVSESRENAVFAFGKTFVLIVSSSKSSITLEIAFKATLCLITNTRVTHEKEERLL
jgi:hypothetical protein